jgi:hypothetical protein
MPNNTLLRSYQHVFPQQPHQTLNKNAQGDVRQDKRASTRARIASAQPARSDIPLRARPTDTKTSRSQTATVDKRRTVQLTVWVEPVVKAEVQRRAKRDDLSDSAVGAAFIKRGLQTDFDMEYGALLTPVFESILKRYMAARDNRLALLLVRACIAIEQTRSLTVNILGRQPKISPDVLNDILDHSLTDAKKKITRRSQELEELITEVQSWVTDQEKKP